MSTSVMNQTISFWKVSHIAIPSNTRWIFSLPTFPLLLQQKAVDLPPLLGIKFPEKNHFLWLLMRPHWLFALLRSGPGTFIPKLRVRNCRFLVWHSMPTKCGSSSKKKKEKTVWSFGSLLFFPLHLIRLNSSFWSDEDSLWQCIEIHFLFRDGEVGSLSSLEGRRSIKRLGYKVNMTFCCWEEKQQSPCPGGGGGGSGAMGARKWNFSFLVQSLTHSHYWNGPLTYHLVAIL